MLAGGTGRRPTTTALKLGHVGIKSFMNPATLVPSPGIRTGFVRGVAFGSFKDSPRDPSVQPGLRTSARTQTVCDSYAQMLPPLPRGVWNSNQVPVFPGALPWGIQHQGDTQKTRGLSLLMQNGTSVAPSTLLGRRDSQSVGMGCAQ